MQAPCHNVEHAIRVLHQQLSQFDLDLARDNLRHILTIYGTRDNLRHISGRLARTVMRHILTLRSILTMRRIRIERAWRFVVEFSMGPAVPPFFSCAPHYKLPTEISEKI